MISRTRCGGNSGLGEGLPGRTGVLRLFVDGGEYAVGRPCRAAARARHAGAGADLGHGSCADQLGEPAQRRARSPATPTSTPISSPRAACGVEQVVFGTVAVDEESVCASTSSVPMSASLVLRSVL